MSNTPVGPRLRPRPKLGGFEPKLAVEMAIRALEIAETIPEDTLELQSDIRSVGNLSHARYCDISFALGLVTQIFPGLMIDVMTRREDLGTGAPVNIDILPDDPRDQWEHGWHEGKPGELIRRARHARILKAIALETVEHLKRLGLIIEAS
ncbi:MAG: hypothetical protein CEN92_133 [Candidatus Berkelbacteria bacterium Licking1014_96]|uniref:Uncharacterized protein n=1 Tax=Candidatus Berkelbacteria bacterium Licking1014_96 TaxID=2017149 RepID=A0A554LGT6_9BACT|nr:MAG: hypothetical protein CEN92_133 [Candidatus Berkelbacteria bacterium Licking1014_96]